MIENIMVTRVLNKHESYYQLPFLHTRTLSAVHLTYVNNAV